MSSNKFYNFVFEKNWKIQNMKTHTIYLTINLYIIFRFER